MQNRVLNTSNLLKPKSETIIPVNCTEGAGRYRSPEFKHAGHISPHKLRKVKSSSVAAALLKSMGHKSDQGAIWREVSKVALFCHVDSPTSALHDVFEAKTSELDSYLQAFKPAPEPEGVGGSGQRGSRRVRRSFS